MRVTVLVSEVDALLPALSASAAKSVMFMVNTFQSLDQLRDAVGPQRVSFGFSALGARLVDDRSPWNGDGGVRSPLGQGLRRRRHSDASASGMACAVKEGLQLLRHLGNSADESRTLIDEMTSAAPGRTPALRAIRPVRRWVLDR